jgi:hypothetical protein
MTTNDECDKTATKGKTTTVLGAMTGAAAAVPN